MKYKITRIVTLGTVFLWTTACEKFLDVNPDMRAELNTVDKIARMVTSAYPNYNYLAMAETYSDNVEDKGPGVGHIADPFPALYRWEDIDDSGNNTPTQYWNGCYAGIAAANQALEAIEEGDYGAEVLPYKGEALLARAYAHFMLVTFFAKAYEIGGNNDSPGIPYVTEPETVTFKNYTRGTVASVYENIRADLEEGLPLLRGGRWNVPKYHFTPAAAHAFAARFYLFAGEWDKVIIHANSIFANGDFTGNLRPQNTKWREFTLAEYNQAVTRADQPYNLLLSETYSVYQRSSASAGARFGFGQTKMSGIYNMTTVAGAPFYNKGINYGVPHYTTYIYNEYFHYSNVAAGIGFPYIMMNLFVADEALMNRAEAYVNQGNYAAALADINQFASVRIVNYNPANHTVTLDRAKTYFDVADDREALMKTILQFKQIAFMGEGMRWFDIIRHRLPVEHNFYNDNGVESVETLTPDDPRRVFQIPQEASLAGIEFNPR